MKKVELTLEEIRSVSLQILDEIHHFCVLNNLKYTLFHGSLLGAVRHKGFIPWDDDMDIAMPRNDYEIFLKIYKSRSSKVISFKHDLRYYLPWAKVYDLNTEKKEDILDQDGLVLGVNIDVYPVDTISDKKQLLKIIKKRKKYERYREYSLCKFSNPFKKMFALFFRGKANKYSQLIDRVNQEFSHGKANYFVTSEVYNVKPTYFSIDMFDNLLLMPFEDREYFVTKNFDELLKKRLGNYTELPPEIERKRHHAFKSYKYIDE